MKKEGIVAGEDVNVAVKFTAAAASQPDEKEEVEMVRQRRGCELCSEGAAAVHCESDRARLCWHCDAQVHAANFLVARHSRVLLCCHCRRPTSWRAAGPRLTPTVSVCLGCSTRSALPPTPMDPSPPPLIDVGEEEGTDETEESESDEDEEEEGEDGDDSQNCLEEEEEEEEGDNQVVPWSIPPAESPAISFSSSSDSESSSDQRPIRTRRILKRMREMRELGSQEDDPPTSSSSDRTSGDEANFSAGALRPAKKAASEFNR